MDSQEVLKSWESLNEHLKDLTEEEIVSLLTDEMLGKRRATTVRRLHERFTMLRAKRERADLMEMINEPVLQS